MTNPLMQVYATPAFLIYISFFIIILFGALVIWMASILLARRRKDRILLIDKDLRWREFFVKTFSRTKATINKRDYYLVKDCGLVNERGKSLYVFTENQPQPLKIETNKQTWISAEQLRGMINNDLIEMMLRPAKSLGKGILLWGAIGGMIAGFASIIILLLELGLINPK